MLLSNKRLKLTARVDLWNESFVSAPQLKRGPLGSMYVKVGLIVLLLILPAACTPPRNSWMLPGLEPPRWGTSEWHTFVSHLRDSLEVTDPQRAADSAIDRGDYHLLGVLQDALAVPGLADWTRYRPGIYILPATGDRIEGEDHASYLRVALEYAERYNRAVLAHRPKDS